MKRRRFLFSLASIYPVLLFPKIGFPAFFPSVKGFIIHRNEARLGDRIQMKGITKNIIDIKIGSSDTGGSSAVIEQTGLTQGGGPPLHIHLNQDEWFYITEGEYFFKVGEDEFNAGEGDMVFMPKQVAHAFVQRTEKARAVVTYVPAGQIEDFFRATAAFESPPSKEEISKVFADHGMKVVGPPPGKPTDH